MKTNYFKQVAELYNLVSDMVISQSEMNKKVKDISIESGISEQKLLDEGYFNSFKK